MTMITPPLEKAYTARLAQRQVIQPPRFPSRCSTGCHWLSLVAKATRVRELLPTSASPVALQAPPSTAPPGHSCSRAHGSARLKRARRCDGSRLLRCSKRPAPGTAHTTTARSAPGTAHTTTARPGSGLRSARRTLSSPWAPRNGRPTRRASSALETVLEPGRAPRRSRRRPQTRVVSSVRPPPVGERLTSRSTRRPRRPLQRRPQRSARRSTYIRRSPDRARALRRRAARTAKPRPRQRRAYPPASPHAPPRAHRRRGCQRRALQRQGGFAPQIRRRREATCRQWRRPR